MSKMAFDPGDAAATVATFIGSSAMAGIASWSLFDVNLADAAFQLAGNDVTLATLLTGVALLATIITNDNTSIKSLKSDAENLDDYYYGSIIACVALLVGWVFVGDVSAFVQSGDLWGVSYIAVSLTGQMAIGYML